MCSLSPPLLACSVTAKTLKIVPRGAELFDKYQKIFHVQTGTTFKINKKEAQQT